MQIKRLVINNNSQLVFSQNKGNFLTNDRSMAAYLKLAMVFAPTFEKFELAQIPCMENAHVDALSKLASGKDFELLTFVPIEHFHRPSNSKGKYVMWIEDNLMWM